MIPYATQEITESTNFCRALRGLDMGACAVMPEVSYLCERGRPLQAPAVNR